MSVVAIQLQLTKAKLVQNGQALIFDKIIYDKNIDYNNQTGEITILHHGVYTIEWWIAPVTTIALDIGFTLYVNNSIKLNGISPTKTSEIYGSTIMKLKDETKIKLVNTSKAGSLGKDVYIVGQNSSDCKEASQVLAYMTIIKHDGEGATGPIGPQGEVGQTGAQGIQGEIGVQGQTGATGDTGPTGSQGVQGPTGIRGSFIYSGDERPHRVLGNNYDIHLNKISGDLFYKFNDRWHKTINIIGPTGEDGQQGIPGPTGPQGVQGEIGPQGIQGDSGEKGDTGATGPQGIQGPAGVRGSIFYSGDKAPHRKLGSDFDVYLNTTTGDMYYKLNECWNKTTNIIGPRGDIGLQGIPGPTGPQGMRGSIFYSGKGVPCCNFGKEYDVYLDVANGDMYYNIQGSWGNPINILWSRGEPGQQGATGPTGATGPGTRNIIDGKSTGAITGINASVDNFMGVNSSAFGLNTKASGDNSFVEGDRSSATEYASHAEGINTIAGATGAHAEGYVTEASEYYAHSEGFSTEASGVASHSEGVNTLAGAIGAHAEGIDFNEGGFSGETQKTQAIGRGSHAEGGGTIASGDFSHSEGVGTTASGFISHAEGDITVASGHYSHAEGQSTIASGYEAHAEGGETIASGVASHTEGRGTTASGECSHAEGCETTASGLYSHAEGEETTASGECSHAEGYGTTTIGIWSHAEGVVTTASGECSHAEGDETTASGKCSHTEGGRTEASGECSHAEGSDTKSIGNSSHVEGCWTTAIGGCSHAEGAETEASGECSHSEGSDTTASGNSSHAEGGGTTASGQCSHAEGSSTTASGKYSHASGWNTAAMHDCMTVIGRYNKVAYVEPCAFIIGNGSPTGTSDALRVTFEGDIQQPSGGTISGSGGDYAEMFEWQDGNVNNEDRVGYFVTLDGRFIRKANSTDKFILGIVSSTPSVIGNVNSIDWVDRYLKDKWGRLQYEYIDVTEEHETIEDGKKVVKEITKKIYMPKTNPLYDPNKEYKSRADRPEWSAIGMLGIMLVRADDTCIVNEYCIPNDEGIATHSASGYGYRVLERLDTDQISILFSSNLIS